MPGDDLIYYIRRAEFELEQLKAATSPKVAAAHHQIAEACPARGTDRTGHD